MRKLFCCLIATVLVFSLVCLVACNDPVELKGEYRYKLRDNGPYYGVKVTVVMQKDRIQQVIVHEETEILINTDSVKEQTYWTNESDDFLQQFVGKTATEIGEIKVVCSYKGEPREIEGMQYLQEIVRPCAHVILAVQDALDVVNVEIPTGPVVYNGEYKYESAWVPGAFYGVKVDVTVVGDVIESVVVTSENTDTYTNLSGNWTDKEIWEEGEAYFLASFAGMTVAEVNALEVACAESGQPNTVTGMEFVTGATQSSGRVILAIQDALSKIPA